MFGEIDKFESQIDTLIKEFSFEEILEMLEVTPEHCLSILLNEGHAQLPPFLNEGNDNGCSS